MRGFAALEQRASYPLVVTVGDVTGTVGWQQGMVWRGYPPGVITNDQAMRLSAVYACLRLLSEAIATLPLDTFRRMQGNRLPYPRPAYLDFTSPGITKIDYLSQVMLSLLTDGNAYVFTPRTAMGDIITLIPVDPALVTVSRVKGEIEYRAGGRLFSPRTELMHIKGMCLPGALVGMSPIAYAAETVGVGLAAQRYGGSFFRNGGVPPAVIEAPGDFSAPGAKRFRETWDAEHAGTENAGKIGVLTGGAKLVKYGINPEEAQFLETRQFTVPDIARIFGVPPHLIADASNSTSWGSGLAEQNLAFGQFSLRPWTERIEEAHGRLLYTDGLEEVFVKLNMDAVLRASLKDRYDSYDVGIKARVITGDEARRLEDMPPLAAKVDPGDIESVGQLIRAGFEPSDALRALGLPPIKHTGTLPITVQPEEGTP